MNPAILNHTYGIIDSPAPFIQELPYDKDILPVNRIETFPGRKEAGK
jgi:hypothetical protein